MRRRSHTRTESPEIDALGLGPHGIGKHDLKLPLTLILEQELESRIGQLGGIWRINPQNHLRVDFLVDPSGGGTHRTLMEGVRAALDQPNDPNGFLNDKIIGVMPGSYDEVFTLPAGTGHTDHLIFLNMGAYTRSDVTALRGATGGSSETAAVVIENNWDLSGFSGRTCTFKGFRFDGQVTLIDSSENATVFVGYDCGFILNGTPGNGTPLFVSAANASVVMEVYLERVTTLNLVDVINVDGPEDVHFFARDCDFAGAVLTVTGTASLTASFEHCTGTPFVNSGIVRSLHMNACHNVRELVLVMENAGRARIIGCEMEETGSAGDCMSVTTEASASASLQILDTHFFSSSSQPSGSDALKLAIGSGGLLEGIIQGNTFESFEDGIVVTGSALASGDGFVVGPNAFVDIGTQMTNVPDANNWQDISLSDDVHALLSATHSDVVAAGVSQGSLIVGNSTPAWAEVTKGADGSLFSSDGTDISWQTDIHLLGYLGIGSASAPTNTTAGDFTYTRGFGQTHDLVHTASEDDEHALEIDVIAGGFNDIKALDIQYTTGALAAGEDDEAVLVNLDEDAALGGRFSAFEMLATTSGAAKAEALFAGVGVHPVEQLSGTFGDPDRAEVEGVDKRTDLINPATNVNIFEANTDVMIIGHANKFEELEYILSTGSSGAGIKPKFEFSSGAGPTWAEFGPSDGTNGMRNTGIIVWEDTDISDVGTWTQISGNYLIRITRQRASLTTEPVCSFLQLAVAQEYSWSKSAVLTVAAILLHNASGTEVADLDITGNADFAGYLHAGSASDPSNTTAGDLTVTRAFIGGAIAIDGSADAVQLTVKGHSTQTNFVALFEQDDGTDLLTLANAGQLALPVSGSGAGLLLGSDVQIYRQGANICRIADTLWIDGSGRFTVAGAQWTFDAEGGGSSGGILYEDSGNTNRFALFFPGSDVVAIANRASNGTVQIRANSATGGGGGESTVAVFTGAQQAQLPGTGSSAGLLVGGDAHLYRVAADVWSTPDSLRVGGPQVIGSESAPTNTTAGDLTISRLFVTDASLDSEARLAQITDIYTPTTGAFQSLFVNVTADPGTGAGSDDIRGAAFTVAVQPTANYAGSAQAFFATATHNSGSFNVGTMRGFFAQAIQNVGSTTATTVTGAQAAYRALAGTITTAIGLDVVRGVGADSGAIGTGIGLRIGVSTGVTPTTDIALQSLGGEHRFVGDVRIGANTAPTVALDVTGAALLSSTLGVTGAATLSGGIASSTTLTGTFTATAQIDIGVEDTTSGVLILYGQATGSVAGGEIRLETAADHDTTIERFNIDVNEDDFRIFRPGQTLLQIHGDDDRVRIVNDLEIDGALNHDGSTFGLYGTAPATKQTISGARDDPEAALANLLTALALVGLIVDSTTAS